MFHTNRLTRLAAGLALGVGLAACGSDPTPTRSVNSDVAAELACPGGSLTGEGSSAQANAINEVIAGYAAACERKATIEYNSTGSGAGIKNFNGGLVDFAGSDSPLKTESSGGVVEADLAEKRCQGNPAWNVPMVIGPIAFAYHVDGVDDLVLNAEVLSEVFSGRIKTWNHAKITELNPDADLPAAPITVFFRSDDSGTTENVTQFLSAAGNGAWKDEPSKAWSGTGEGKNKSSGVAQGVRDNNNSISYMEWSYAKDNQLPIAQLDNGAGATELSGATVAAAVDEATVKGTGNDLALDIKYTGTAADAYPALLVTYEIVCSEGLAPEKTALLKDFLGYFAAPTTQASLEEIGYAPLPEQLLTKVQETITAVQ